MTEVAQKKKMKENGFKKPMNNGVEKGSQSKNRKAAAAAAHIEKKKQEPAVRHSEGCKWWEYTVEGKIVDPAKDSLSAEETRKLEEEADLLLRTDVDLYNKFMRTQGGSEAGWLQQVVKSGTSTDRLTAMQLQTRGSPVHSLLHLRTLVGMTGKKHQREAAGVLPVIEELFTEELLPANRKLMSFNSRPLARVEELSEGDMLKRRRLLVLWAFEHELKKIYEELIRGLEQLAGGAQEAVGFRALKTITNLLAERPEAEQFLLTTLVNKLGHPNYKVAAKVSEQLDQLSRRQPNMRPVIVKEVERLIYRRNISEKAQMYAASFLSQIVLRAGETQLALHLLSIYFGLFKTLVARKKTNNRLIALLLTGANRALPYAKDKADALSEDIDALYKVVHQSTYLVSLQTLKLLFQVLQLSDSVSDRFYSALYRKLIEPVPPPAYNQLLLLLFKTLKSDTMVNRVRAFVKRMLQVAVNEQPPLAAGLMVVISRLRDEKPDVIVTERNPDPLAIHRIDMEDDEEERYVDLDEEGKPIQQIKIEKEGDSDGEDEEVKVVGKGAKTNGVGKTKEDKKPIKGRVQPSASTGWVHRKNNAHRGATDVYSHEVRNPVFADCSMTFDAELLLLKNHYHPSISIYATSLLRGNPVKYSGDPLEDYTLMKFLDRFVYRNPKQAKKESADDGTDPSMDKRKVLKKKTYDPWGIKALSIDSKEYLSKRREEVPADERYLHRFATMKLKVAGEKDNDEDVESVNSDEFEQLLTRFEPGEKNDEFDLDFSKEFSSEKTVKKGKAEKRKRSSDDESDGEDDDEFDDEEGDVEDGEDDEDIDMGGDDDEEGALSMEEDEDWDDDEVAMAQQDEEPSEDEDDDDDADETFFGGRGLGGMSGLSKNKKDKNVYDSDSDDGDFGDNDAFVSADKFGEMLEDVDDPREMRKLAMKHNVRRPKGFKPHGGKKKR